MNPIPVHSALHRWLQHRGCLCEFPTCHISNISTPTTWPCRCCWSAHLTAWRADMVSSGLQGQTSSTSHQPAPTCSRFLTHQGTPPPAGSPQFPQAPHTLGADMLSVLHNTCKVNPSSLPTGQFLPELAQSQALPHQSSMCNQHTHHASDCSHFLEKRAFQPVLCQKIPTIPQGILLPHPAPTMPSSLM